MDEGKFSEKKMKEAMGQTHDAVGPSSAENVLDDGALLGTAVCEPATKGEL